MCGTATTIGSSLRGAATRITQEVQQSRLAVRDQPDKPDRDWIRSVFDRESPMNEQRIDDAECPE